MHYDSIRTNLPGPEGYQPDLPWVMKCNKLAKAIIGDVSTFVDGMRAAGFKLENAWQVGHQFAAWLPILGNSRCS
jgi:hypothetical protein